MRVLFYNCISLLAGDERLAAAMQMRRKSNEKVGVLLAENASLRKEKRLLLHEFARLKARWAELGGKRRNQKRRELEGCE